MYNFTNYFSMMAGNRDKSHHGKPHCYYNITGCLCQSCIQLPSSEKRDDKKIKCARTQKIIDNGFHKV